jgi:nitrite reductase (NADH) large subunit
MESGNWIVSLKDTVLNDFIVCSRTYITSASMIEYISISFGGFLMTHLIIGSGAAGIACAGKLREIDPSVDIVIASSDTEPYMKMYLPDYISGTIKPEKILTGDLTKGKKNNIIFSPGKTLASIDPENRRAYFFDESSMDYDKLLIAAGTRAVMPQVDMDEDVVYYVPDSLDSIKNITEKIIPLDKAVVIGAGATGIQTAVSLSKAGLHVTIIENRPIILKRHLDKIQSDTLIRVLDKMGIRVLVSHDSLRIKKDMMISDKGDEIQFDHLFFCCGQEPCTDFLKDSGIKHDPYIGIDKKGMTNIEDIYAAGSVAAAVCNLQAVRQAETAACNMAGIEDQVCEGYYPFLMRDLELSFYGRHDPADGNEEIIVKQKHEYKKLVLDHGSLSGFIFIGDCRKTKTALSFIYEKKTVGDAELRELMG